MPAFNLESWLEHSKRVQTSDLDFAGAARHPLTAGEIRCLTYMMDVESHVIVFLREVLFTCAIRDPRTTAFLSCWAYEEFFHGHALRRFLEAAGAPVPPARAADVQRKSSWHDWLHTVGASLICQCSRHFQAAYLAWGAISELMTLESYGILAGRTTHPVLPELLRRLVKDERRHFAFYYNMAEEHLAPRAAQGLTSRLIRHVWMPVGSGTRPRGEVDWMIGFLFGDEHGALVAERIDATIRRLPGLRWFDRVTRSRHESLRRLGPALEVAAAGG